MVRITCAFAAMLTVISPPALFAQDGPVIGRAEAEKALIHKVEAVYPPIALDEHIMGIVELRARVGADGKVVSTTVVSGHPILRQAAVDAVSQWQYTPFVVDGKAVPAVANVSVSFSLPEPGVPEHPSLAEGCHMAMGSVEFDLEKTLDLCGRAAAEADTYAPDSHFIERRSAYVFYAAALLRAHKFADAEIVARKGVAVVRQGHDDDSGRSAAYAVLGNAEAMLGKLDAAAVDIQTAENYERTAIEHSDKPGMGMLYRHTLRTILLFHADLLDRLDRPLEAQARRDEAALL